MEMVTTQSFFANRIVAPLTIMGALAGIISAADFSLEIGNPAAALVKVKKNATLVVRPLGCSEGANFHIEGNSVQASGETQVSVPLTFGRGGTSTPVFAVGASPSLGGTFWLMVLSADCAGSKAGALIPIDARGVYNRAAAKFLNHAPTKKEIDDALKTLARDTARGDSK
ncbi:MAG: hypothetical protein ABI824_04705 [Acidobacteriota bacterium]